ncbi:cytochrome c family protein [Massilia sp. IC2-477]|uniref:c-type cytochrome n=1 Tax=Massilia sp. IC2-477 TaxID=2887198 RepID=UPI001D0F529A|nr:cytochrome c family protein [Massilia sp. IC2-477]MCC2955673.1 cytochrome c family protein [Massilia sp. IC2-477]
MRSLVLAILLLGTASTAHAADPLAAGRSAFKRCANCHQVGPNAQSNFGPQLNGILGRRAGSLPDYAYSPAMKKAGFAWDERRLAAFIRDPDAVVPGTRMRFWGFLSERQVGDIVVYLRSFPPAVAPAKR